MAFEWPLRVYIEDTDFGGINEKGLVVEIMLSGADYENYDDRKAINSYNFV